MAVTMHDPKPRRTCNAMWRRELQNEIHCMLARSNRTPAPVPMLGCAGPFSRRPKGTQTTIPVAPNAKPKRTRNTVFMIALVIPNRRVFRLKCLVLIGWSPIRKRSTCPQNGASSDGRRNTFLQSTCRSPEAECLSGTLIQAQRDLVELRMRDGGQVGSSRKVLSH
jgi:hypothetical protein